MLLSLTKDTIYRPTRQTFVTERSNYWLTVESEKVLCDYYNDLMVFYCLLNLDWWNMDLNDEATVDIASPGLKY